MNAKLNFRTTLKCFGIILASSLLMPSTPLSAQTINIGPNQYAFRFTQNPNYGLFFNATNVRYEFRNGTAAPIFAFSADNGNMTTDLQFATGNSIRVAPGNYAFRSPAAPNAGLFFGATDYELRTTTGAAAFSLNAINSNAVFAGTIAAQGGNSTQWNQAHSWGNHATAGYLTGAALNLGAVPRWSGSQFQNSAITATTSNARIIGSPSLLASGAIPGGSLLILENPGTGGTFNTTESRIAFTKDNALIAQMGSAGNDFVLRMGGSDRFRMTPDGNVGFGTAPTAGSTIIAQKSTSGVGAAVEAVVDFTGNTDVNALRATSVTNPGFGIGVNATGGFIGVRAIAQNTSATSTTYGLFAAASGSGGTRIGVYGSATGSGNWAGYFVGNEYISGDLRVGTLNGATGYRVSVNGNIMCTELRVLATANWPDYVFGESHNRMSLEELEQFIDENKHLPGIPSAAEIAAQEGFDIGDMQKRTLEKVEELTLYIIEQNKLMSAQQQSLVKQQEMLDAQREKLQTQQAEIENLKKQLR